MRVGTIRQRDWEGAERDVGRGRRGRTFHASSMWSAPRSEVSDAVATMPPASTVETVPTFLAGAPAQTSPAGTLVPGASTAPAASAEPLPSVQPLPTLQPRPTEHSSASVDRVTTLPAPMTALAPTTLPTTIALSPTTDISPMLAGLTPPLTMLPYQTDAPAESLTAPTRLALGAMKLAPPTAGDCPPTLTAVVGITSPSEYDMSPMMAAPALSSAAAAERRIEPAAYHRPGGPGGRAAHANELR